MQFNNYVVYINKSMRYYLGNCEYKWTHKNTQMEIQTMPGDIYCRCDIYAEIPDSKQATLFALKFSNVRKVELI